MGLDALAGALGACAAEIAAEFAQEMRSSGVNERVLDKLQKQDDAEGHTLLYEDFEKAYQAELQLNKDIGKISAAMAGLLAGRDVNQCADAALTHNFIIYINLFAHSYLRRYKDFILYVTFV